MVGASRTLQNASETLSGVFADHGRWMAWNTLLALVPLGLALVLFRSGTRRTLPWWLGFGAFLAFLPNAPYVLSDVIHFFDDVRATTDRHNLRVMFGVLPVYAVFFAVGFGAYVVCLRRARRYAAAELGLRAGALATIALHVVASVGVFLGRFWRFNSWDLVTAPDSLAYRLDDLMHRWPIGVIGVTFVSLFVLTTVVELLLDGIELRRRRAALVRRASALA